MPPVTGRVADGHKFCSTACCFDPSHCGCEMGMNDPTNVPSAFSAGFINLGKCRLQEAVPSVVGGGGRAWWLG